MATHLPLRLGTRASPLAQWQADWVTARLEESGVNVERVLIATSGDRNQADTIAGVGVVGVFTKEIQRALFDGRIDVAVHSLKDLPTDTTPGLVLAAIPERGPCGDVLVTLDGRPLADLPNGARIGTGSLRRRAHLWHFRPDLAMLDIRGNVDTRIRKLRDGEYDGLVLAEAGLARLGLAAGMTWAIDHEILLPAVGQGALAVETRAATDKATETVFAAVARLDHALTRRCVLAERTVLAELCAGCLAPVGAHGRIDANGELVLSASVLSATGDRKLIAEVSGPTGRHLELGLDAARRLKEQGADELITQAREHN